MGSVVGEKVTRAVELGLETRTPVLVCSARRARGWQEGTISLMQMAKTPPRWRCWLKRVSYFTAG